MLVAMMAFYEEPIGLIESSVAGLSAIGVEHLVVADGAYALYPDGSPSSDPGLAAMLGHECGRRGIRLTYHVRDEVWEGNEVEKRQQMLDLALERSCPRDWLVIWDCDYKLVTGPSPSDLARRLDLTDCDVATISFTEDPNAGDYDDVEGSGYYPMGMFLRARPGIIMDGNHHTYLLPDGRRTQVLCRPVENEVEALHLPDVRVLHDVHRRDPERRARQAAYYEARDRLQVES